MNILTINAGSSSIKYKLFQSKDHQLTPVINGLIENIGGKQGQWHHQEDIKKTVPHTFKNHQQAFEALADKLKDQEIKGVGHRVVHGGEIYYQPTLIDDKVLATIKSLSILAPIHNPINAEGIEFARRYFKNAYQVAVFDSGFHHSMPEAAYTYAIDHQTAKDFAIRRYGFHGINHEYVAHQAALHLGKPLEQCQLISLHLGNGASACLIKNGHSQDTSMGLTPLAGLIMGTRCGDIDPAIPLFLQEQGMSLKEVDELLNKKSGLMGIAGDNDMRHLCQRAENADKEAILAIAMYVYAVQKMIGSYFSQTPALDALIFTGGVGENAAIIRKQIIAPLQHLGLAIDQDKNTSSDFGHCENIASMDLPVLVIKGNEEIFIAEQVVKLCR